MKIKTIPPPTISLFLLPLFFAVAVLLAGCGDSSVNDNGDPDPDPDPDPPIEASQREAIIVSFLNLEMDFVQDDEEEEFMLKGISRRWAKAIAQAHDESFECPGGGSQTFTQETKNVGSPYANQLDVQRMAADNCRQENSDFFANGIHEFGGNHIDSHEDNTVFYLMASDLGGNPDSGGHYVSQFPGFISGNPIRQEMRGLYHGCMNCSNPQAGGDWEFLASMEWAWINHEGEELRYWTGEDSGNPSTYIINLDEANDTAALTMTGRFGSSVNTNQCSYDVDAVYTTLSPIVIENFLGESDNDDDHMPVSGELRITEVNGAWTHTIEYRNGDVHVDGVRIDPEEYEDYIEECVFEVL